MENINNLTINKIGQHFHNIALRDYFASQAMNALIINGKVNGADLIAMRAYEQADAMMDARK